jgi:hypothetical protein
MPELFADFSHVQDGSEAATNSSRHDQNRFNAMILGDSLRVVVSRAMLRPTIADTECESARARGADGGAPRGTEGHRRRLRHPAGASPACRGADRLTE